MSVKTPIRDLKDGDDDDDDDKFVSHYKSKCFEQPSEKTADIRLVNKVQISMKDSKKSKE